MKLILFITLLSFAFSSRFKLKTDKEVYQKIDELERTGKELIIQLRKQVKYCQHPIQLGDYVSVHYNGTLSDGAVFDTTSFKGEPFSFQIGTQKVIQGWERGLLGRCKGEELTLIIPSHLGYGSADNGVIPPNSILYFDISVEQVTAFTHQYQNYN